MVALLAVASFVAEPVFASRRVAASNGRTVLFEHDNRELRASTSTDLFGRELTAEDYANLAGAPPNSTIAVRNLFGPRLELKVNRIDMFAWFETQRTAPDSQVDVNVGVLFAQEGSPRGLGTSVMVRVIETAQSLGVGRLSVNAANEVRTVRRTRIEYRGYDFFPRLGFEAPLDKELAAAASAHLQRPVTTLNQVMLTREGRAWWRTTRIQGARVEATLDFANPISMLIYRGFRSEIQRKFGL